MLDICAIPEPSTGTEGKFSLRHVASLVLAGRSTGPSGFSDEMVHDPELRVLRARVAVEASGSETGHETEVTLCLADGRELTAQSDARAPTADDELQREWPVLCGKFGELAEPVLGRDRVDEIVTRVDRLEREEDLAALLALTRRAADGR
jgi:2-methylcitrate dehydratase PrpD